MFQARKVRDISRRMVEAIKDEFGDECVIAEGRLLAQEMSEDEARKRGWI